MGRAPCCDKNNGLKKGPWTTEEDQKLIDYIQKHGYGNWRTLPKNAGLQRCGKSCRLRWTNYLRPDIKRGRFSFEEEETIIQLHSILGNKWSAIAARLPGRTDNEIKNYWNTHIRKRLLRMGIDPVTHSPRLDLVDLSSILNSSLYASYHHHRHQMNMSRLLGGIQQQQHFVNPEILKIATSLLSSQRENQQQNLVLQSNGQQNQLCGPQVQSQNQPLVQGNQFQSEVHQGIPTCTALTSTTPPCSSTSTVAPFSNAVQLIVHPNVEEYPSGMTDFGSQNSELSHDQYWQSNTGGIASNFNDNDFVPLLPCYDNYNGSDQANIMDPSSISETNSTFISNENFSFASVLSTPSSSSTPLRSDFKVDYVQHQYSSSTTTTEDESYCSNMLKFDIPDILDVTNFM